jgi:hypothetical protein
VALSPRMFLIVDREKHAIVDDFETREDAEKRLRELIAADPLAEGVLVIETVDEPREGA